MSDITKKPAVAKVLFGRTAVVALLCLLQIAVVFVGFWWFYDFIEYIIGGFTLLSAGIVVWIINDESNPAFKLAWILPVLVFPVLGGCFYLFVETNLGGRQFRKRVKAVLDKTNGLLQTAPETRVQLENTSLQPLSNYVAKVSGLPVYQNTDVTYFSMGELKFEEMKKQLRLAKSFIFLEYFIIEEGLFWNELLEILMQKAQEGVDVRVIYDGLGCMLTLPRRYDETLKRAGIKAKVFSPVIPLLSTHQNNRDHRKILVIDGTVAFNGGVNLADEYINEKVVFGHWKDVAVMLQGAAVQSFTLMFLQMWNIDEKQPEAYTNYLQVPSDVRNKGFVMPYCDSPLDRYRIGEAVYMDIIHKAKRYVHIMTPYLILDNELLMALIVAANSGIEVKIMLPHIPDQQMPFDIARSFYASLLEAGVRIYEYTPGFVHAKLFVSDDEKAVVGTINMDYRSLYHHFECATYMEHVGVIREIEADFQKTLEQCEEMTKERVRQLPFARRFLGKLLRLVAPLV